MIKNDTMIAYITDRAPHLAPFNYFSSVMPATRISDLFTLAS